MLDVKVMTLPAEIRLLADALEHTVAEVPVHELPALIAALAGAQARAYLRLATPAAPEHSGHPIRAGSAGAARSLLRAQRGEC